MVIVGPFQVKHPILLQRDLETIPPYQSGDRNRLLSCTQLHPPQPRQLEVSCSWRDARARSKSPLARFPLRCWVKPQGTKAWRAQAGCLACLVGMTSLTAAASRDSWSQTRGHTGSTASPGTSRSAVAHQRGLWVQGHLGRDS